MAFNVNRHWLVSRNNYFKWCKGGMDMFCDIVRVFGVPYSFTLKKRDLFENGEIDANMVQEIMESNVDRILKEVEKDMPASNSVLVKCTLVIKVYPSDGKQLYFNSEKGILY